MSLSCIFRQSRLVSRHVSAQRQISTSVSLSSGHNREIVVAAKRGGSVDPSLNVQLAVCLRKARAAGVPKDNIEKALTRAGDKAKQDSYTALLYEAIGPGQTGFIIECQSDNIKRTNSAINSILKDRGARSAAVAYLFSRNGSITFTPKEGIDADAAWEAAIEVGAEDVEITDDGDIQLLTPPDTMLSIAESLQSHPAVAAIGDITLIYRPNDPAVTNPDELTDEEKEIDEAVGRIVNALEDNDDTVAVWTTRG